MTYLEGSLNIGLGGKYATWAGTLLSPERSIVIVAEPDREEEATTLLGWIGFDRIGGYLEEGMAALEPRQDLVARTNRIIAGNLRDRMGPDNAPVVFNVATEKEWEEERIEGSLNIPLNHLQERSSELEDDREIVVYCASGYRSAIASSLLDVLGKKATDLVGGLSGWEAAGLPVEGSEQQKANSRLRPVTLSRMGDLEANLLFEICYLVFCPPRGDATRKRNREYPLNSD